MYTGVYTVTKQQTMAAGTSSPSGKWNSLSLGQSLGYLAMGGSLLRSERERGRRGQAWLSLRLRGYIFTGTSTGIVRMLLPLHMAYS